ncbi:hypothetical protein KC363_g82 [Hortaea werneckii]|nr:hypothetical protein KC363_g82 [Hortaea werneckii]
MASPVPWPSHRRVLPPSPTPSGTRFLCSFRARARSSIPASPSMWHQFTSHATEHHPKKPRMRLTTSLGPTVALAFVSGLLDTSAPSSLIKRIDNNAFLCQRDEEVVLGVTVVREAVDEDQTSFCLCRLGWSSCSGDAIMRSRNARGEWCLESFLRDDRSKNIEESCWIGTRSVCYRYYVNVPIAQHHRQPQDQQLRYAEVGLVAWIHAGGCPRGLLMPEALPYYPRGRALESDSSSCTQDAFDLSKQLTLTCILNKMSGPQPNVWQTAARNRQSQSASRTPHNRSTNASPAQQTNPTQPPRQEGGRPQQVQNVWAQRSSSAGGASGSNAGSNGATPASQQESKGAETHAPLHPVTRLQREQVVDVVVAVEYGALNRMLWPMGNRSLCSWLSRWPRIVIQTCSGCDTVYCRLVDELANTSAWRSEGCQLNLTVSSNTVTLLLGCGETRAGERTFRNERHSDLVSA